MYDAQQNDDTQHSSPTAIVCEQAELFGATPGPDEPDNRDLWGQDDAMQAVDSAFHAFATDIAPRRHPARRRARIVLWGFVNLFHAQVNRLDRAVDALKTEAPRPRTRPRTAPRINAYELERTVDRARALGDRPRRLREDARTTPPSAYRTETGSTWRPTARARTSSQTGKDHRRRRHRRPATSFVPASTRANEAHLPDGTLVAVAGGKEAGNVNAICSALDSRQGAPPPTWSWCTAADRARSASRRAGPRTTRVHQVVFRPDWDAHGRAGSVPAQRPAPQAPPERASWPSPAAGISENLVEQGALSSASRSPRFDA